MNNTTSSKIFGVPLLDVISYTPECKMPIVVKEMILYLLKNGKFLRFINSFLCIYTLLILFIKDYHMKGFSKNHYQ